MKLIVVRHGEAGTNLTATGKDQIRALAACIKKKDLMPVAILTSQAPSAEQSGQLLAGEFKKASSGPSLPFVSTGFLHYKGANLRELGQLLTFELPEIKTQANEVVVAVTDDLYIEGLMEGLGKAIRSVSVASGIVLEINPVKPKEANFVEEVKFDMS